MRNQLSDILSCISVLWLPLSNGRPFPFVRVREMNLTRLQTLVLLWAATSCQKSEKPRVTFFPFKKKEREKLKLNLCSRHESLFGGSGSAHLTFLRDSGSMAPGAGLGMNWLSPIKLQLNKRTRLGGSSETSALIFSSVLGEGEDQRAAGGRSGVRCRGEMANPARSFQSAPG